MKRHWAKTPDYPDGLWQAYDPDLTLNLTEDERRKCKETEAKRSVRGFRVRGISVY